MPLDFSFSGLMDRTHPEVARYFAASDRYGLGGLLPLLIEGPEDRLDEAVLRVQLALDDLDIVHSVTRAPSNEWLLARAPFIVDGPIFEQWLALAEAPDDAALRAVLEGALAFGEQSED